MLRVRDLAGGHSIFETTPDARGGAIGCVELLGREIEEHAFAVEESNFSSSAWVNGQRRETRSGGRSISVPGYFRASVKWVIRALPTRRTLQPPVPISSG